MLRAVILVYYIIFHVVQHFVHWVHAVAFSAGCLFTAGIHPTGKVCCNTWVNYIYIYCWNIENIVTDR